MWQRINQWLQPLLRPLLTPLLTQWLALAPRERRMIGLMGAVMGVALVYFLVWLPLEQARTQAQAQKQWAQQQHQWLNTQLRQMPATSRQAPAMPDAWRSQAGLLGWLQQQVRQAQLHPQLQSLTPLGANRANGGNPPGVRLSFEAVNANALYQLLARIEQQGLSPRRLEMEATEQSGRVDARLAYRVKMP